MSATVLDPVEISSVGPAVDSRGKPWNITAEMLQQIAETYDPTIHEAPILVNHDKAAENKGLTKALKFDGHSLMAYPHRMDSEFADKVNEGRWPKLSAGFYGPDAPENPHKGKWALQEFSVVQIPGKKGLASPRFSEPEQGVHYFIFGEPMSKSNSDGDSTAPAPDAPPENAVAPPPVEDQASAGDDLSAREKALADREAALKQRESQASARESALADQEAAAAEAELAAFCEGQVGEGFAPFLVPHVKTIAKVLRSHPGSVTFGEGDDAQDKDPIEVLKEFVRSVRLEGVRFGEGEIAGGDDAPKARSPKAVAAKASKIQSDAKAAGEDITDTEAVRRAGGN
ncbi:MAG: hypothetical protein AAF889_15055 [Cyanobacteria bacterium P01_D01_bin.73]